MPKFISPIGTPCTIDEAKPGGRLRAGYKELLDDGEYLPFNVMFRDAAPARSAAVFLTDSSPRDLYVDRLTGAPEGSTAKARSVSRALADARMTMPTQLADAQAKRDAARQEYVDGLTAPRSQSMGPAMSRARYAQGGE